jgi:hypothetical protein
MATPDQVRRCMKGIGALL